MNDIELSFDPKLFLKGMESINASMDRMNGQFSEFAQKGTKAVQKTSVSMGSFVKGTIVAQGVMKVLNKIMSGMPEIGRTFSMVGDIMQRNLLWPLRKALLPYLQKILDWTRDNRAMFVRWGNVLANIFRIIVDLVKTFYDMVKRLWDRLTAGIERVFGKTVNTMTELVNVLLFKITAVAQWIMLTVEPIVGFIIDAFMGMLTAAREFFAGFSKGFGDIGADLDDFLGSISRLLDKMTGLKDTGGAVVKTFRTLGTVLGMVLGPVVRTLLQLFDNLGHSIDMTSNSIALFRAGSPREKARLLREREKLQKDFQVRSKDRADRQMEAWKSGVSDIKDTWTGGNNGGQTINNDNSKVDVKIEVNGAGDPVQTADEVQKKFNNSLQNARFKSGIR